MIPTNSLNPDDKTKRQQSKTNPNEYLTGYTVKLGYIWAGVILCMKPMNANEDVKLSLIGWSHTQNDSCYQRDSIIHPQNQTMATIKRSIITRKVLLQKLTFYSNYLGLTSSLTQSIAPSGKLTKLPFQCHRNIPKRLLMVDFKSIFPVHQADTTAMGITGYPLEWGFPN